jgi:hypothetical protein
MKAILLALVFATLLLAAVSIVFNGSLTEKRGGFLLRASAFLLPFLILAHLFTRADLGVLPASLVTPVSPIDLAFSVFLFVVASLGGVAQLYNLADRGFSLRILIDILEAPDQTLTAAEVMVVYSAGRGIAWMYEKRVTGMLSAGLIELAGDEVVLTAKGYSVAEVFANLQDFARVLPLKATLR